MEEREGANVRVFNIQPLSNCVPVPQTVVVFPQTSSKQNGDMRFVFQSTCRKTTEGMLVSVLQCIQNSETEGVRRGINCKIKKKKTALATCEAQENKLN